MTPAADNLKPFGDQPVVCAIHQPNFFPWLGYFDKIRRADVFVWLDAVDYPRSGSGGMGSWVNRVRLDVSGAPRWVGAPLHRMPFGSKINDALIDDRQPWRSKLLRTLQANYAASANFTSTLPFLASLIQDPETSLAAFNIAAVSAIAARLCLDCRFVRQSDLEPKGHATELLISTTKAAGAAVYLCGGGALGYQEDAMFEGSGVKLRYQNFLQRDYARPGGFVPGLSVIDYLMHDGRPLAEAFPDA